jgi:hypothetical protein
MAERGEALPHAAFLLLTATPAWLALDGTERERIVGNELLPILDRHRHTVTPATTTPRRTRPAHPTC